MKYLLSVFICLISIGLFAQTGIGTTTPNASAKLDVYATNKGFLPPRVTLTSSTDASTIASPATGLLVYNTGTNAGLRAGYYYWNGTDWTTIATPTSAETVDYVSTSLSSNIAGVGSNTDIKLQQLNGGNIPYNTATGVYTLSANKTYILQAQLRVSNASISGAYLAYTWVDANSNVELITNSEALSSSNTSGATFGSKDIVQIIYTPTSNQTVKLRSITASGTQTIWHGTASIVQIGSNAIINPWVLSGNDVYNTTGKVGIGNNAPTATLDVTGSLVVSGVTNLKNTLNVGTGSGSEGGEIDLANAASGNTTLTGGTVAVDVYGDKLRIFENGGNNRGVNIDLSKAPNNVAGELIWKASGIVNAGTFVQMDNIKATVTTSGSRGISVAAVSTSFYCNIGASFANSGGGSGGNSAYNQNITTTPTSSWFGWSFGGAGDTAVYTVTDTTNNRMYRITMQIGASYNNNSIVIERLF